MDNGEPFDLIVESSGEIKAVPAKQFDEVKTEGFRPSNILLRRRMMMRAKMATKSPSTTTTPIEVIELPDDDDVQVSKVESTNKTVSKEESSNKTVSKEESTNMTYDEILRSRPKIIPTTSGRRIGSNDSKENLSLDELIRSTKQQEYEQTTTESKVEQRKLKKEKPVTYLEPLFSGPPLPAASDRSSAPDMPTPLCWRIGKWKNDHKNVRSHFSDLLIDEQNQNISRKRQLENYTMDKTLVPGTPNPGIKISLNGAKRCIISSNEEDMPMHKQIEDKWEICVKKSVVDALHFWQDVSDDDTEDNVDESGFVTSCLTVSTVGYGHTIDSAEEQASTLFEKTVRKLKTAFKVDPQSLPETAIDDSDKNNMARKVGSNPFLMRKAV